MYHTHIIHIQQGHQSPFQNGSRPSIGQIAKADRVGQKVLLQHLHFPPLSNFLIFLFFFTSNPYHFYHTRHSERLRVFALTSPPKASSHSLLATSVALYKSYPSSRRTNLDMDTHRKELIAVEQTPSVSHDTKEFPSSSTVPVHATPEVVGIDDKSAGERDGDHTDAIQGDKGRWFAYLKTREFYLVLLLGYGTTRTHLLSKEAVSYAEMDATQANPSPLSDSHQYIFIAPCGTQLLHPRFSDFVELYRPRAGLWLLYNL